MIWEIVKIGWKAWREHKVSGIPFFISGIVSTSVFLLLTLFVVHIISPELPGLILTGAIANVGREYIAQLFERYLENVDLIFSAILAAILLFVIFDAFFRAWGIKVCSDALKCDVKLVEGLWYAKSRYLPFLVYNLLLQSITFAGAIPLYYVIRGIDKTDIHSVVQSAIAFLVWAIVLMIVTSVILFLFTFVPYAIVLDGESVLTSIKKGYRVLRISITETVIFWLLLVLVGMLTWVPFYPLQLLGFVGFVVSHILSIIAAWLIVAPIVTSWWIELYKRKSKML